MSEPDLVQKHTEKWKALMGDRSLYPQPHIEKLFEWFTASWLEAGGNTSIQQLWHRHSFPAVVELHLLADALLMVDPLISQKTRDSMISDLKSTPDLSDGTAFELLFGALLMRGEEKVEYPPANQPGFDLTVKRGDKHLRVSCKHLQSSKHFYRFHTFMVYLDGLYRSMLRPGERLSILLTHHKYNPTDYRLDLLKHFAEALNEYRAFRDDPTKRYQRIFGLHLKDTQWLIQFFPMVTAPNGVPFHPAYRSYVLNGFGERQAKEQVRVISKLEEGIKKFKVKSFPQTPDHFNMVALRIPAEVSLKDVETYIQTYWQLEHSNVAGACLIRHQITHATDLTKRSVTVEFRWLENPYSSQKISEFTAGQPLRFVTDSAAPSPDETQMMLISGNQVTPMPTTYHYGGGEVHLKAAPEGLVEIVNIPNVTMRGVLEMEGGQHLIVTTRSSEAPDILLLL